MAEMPPAAMEEVPPVAAEEVQWEAPRAAMEELASSPTGNEQVLPEGVNCADTVAET